MTKRSYTTTTFVKIPVGTIFQTASGFFYRKITPTSDEVGKINAQTPDFHVGGWIDDNARVTVEIPTKKH